MNESKRRILFATAPIGVSHTRALEAIASAMTTEFNDVETKVVNVFDYVNPTARAILTKGYDSMRSMAPGLWGVLYEKESLADSLAPAENFTRSVRWDELRAVLADFPPEVVVASHPFATAPFVRLKREGALEVPIVSVLTDFQIHNIDVQEGISLYTCADAKLADELARRGVERELIYPCGVPLPSSFAENRDRAALRKQFGLDDTKKVILVLAKGWEPDIADRLLFQLSLLRTPHQILISSGGNDELADRLRRFAGMYGVRAKLFGAVDNLIDFIAAADLVVTKGGGATAAECLSAGLPLIILNPSAGPEERVSRFLVDRGVAREASGVLALGAEIDLVLGDAGTYQPMRDAAAELYNANAARDAGRAVYLAAQNRQEILRRERELPQAAASGATQTPGGGPLFEEIGQERPSGPPPNLSRDAAKELLTGWILNEKDAQRRYEEALEQTDRWQRRAEIAARRNEDDLAKEALRRAEEMRRELLLLENELRRISAEKAKITGRFAGSPATSGTLGQPNPEQTELESRFLNMELDDELQRLKRRLEGGDA